MARLFDLVIIGAGASGMSAAIYAGRAKLKTAVLEREREGGQIKITDEVVNYPGILNTSGAALTATMRQQAEKFGVEFVTATVQQVESEGYIRRVYTSSGEYVAKAVIIATGAVPRTLGFEGEQEFKGRGVGYCATCDGEFFTNKEVFVVGGGLAAAEEALFLTRYASKVTLLVRRDKLAVPRSVADKVAAEPKIELHYNTELKQVGGDHALRFAELLDNKTGETIRFDVASANETFGVFVFAGYVPQTADFAELVELDKAGYIVTDASMRTSEEGIYAAGDVRPKELRQLVTAVSDGAIAATNAEKYIEHVRDTLGLPAIGATSERHTSNEAVCKLSVDSEQSKPGGQQTAAAVNKAVFFSSEIVEQLSPILERLRNPISIVAITDSATKLGAEIQTFLTEFAALTSKVSVEYLEASEAQMRLQALGVTILPSIVFTDTGGQPLGVQFHGVPSGHELNSFVLALYNACGPGQTISDEQAERIAAINKPINLKVGATLSCTMCPDVVQGSQLIALRNPNVSAEMLDVSHCPDFRNQYNIMSVPAIVINDEQLEFGKQSLDELLDLIA